MGRHKSSNIFTSVHIPAPKPLKSVNLGSIGNIPSVAKSPIIPLPKPPAKSIFHSISNPVPPVTHSVQNVVKSTPINHTVHSISKNASVHNITNTVKSVAQHPNNVIPTVSHLLPPVASASVISSTFSTNNVSKPMGNIFSKIHIPAPKPIKGVNLGAVGNIAKTAEKTLTSKSFLGGLATVGTTALAFSPLGLEAGLASSVIGGIGSLGGGLTKGLSSVSSIGGEILPIVVIVGAVGAYFFVSRR